MADHRPDAYFHDGKLILRASALGFCDKRIVAGALGHEPLPTPDALQRAFDEGADNEDRVLKMWRNGDRVEGPYAVAHADDQGQLPQWFGLDPSAAGSYKTHRDASDAFPHCTLGVLDDDQFTVEWTVGNVGGYPVVIRGHMDGIAQCFAACADGEMATGVRVVEEAKLLGPDYYRKWLTKGWDAFPYYATQVSIYGYATGLPVAFIVGQKIREDGDGEGVEGGVRIPNVHVTWVEGNVLPVRRGQIMARALKLAKQIVDAKNGGDMPVCTSADYPCPFVYLHDEADGAAGDARKKAAKKDAGVREITVPESDGAILRRLAANYADAQKAEAAAKAYRQEIATDLAAMLAPYKADREKALVTLPDGTRVEWVVRHTLPATREVKESWSEYPKVTLPTAAGDA